MDRGAWRDTDYGVTKSDMMEHTLCMEGYLVTKSP